MRGRIMPRLSENGGHVHTSRESGQNKEGWTKFPPPHTDTKPEFIRPSRISRWEPFKEETSQDLLMISGEGAKEGRVGPARIKWREEKRKNQTGHPVSSR
uniref:Uncharacterized protein n=1 Tax=Micrurus lemniscatus lemniscatus TaxID=129467 RepID=A0A2D4I6Z0_MICLE